MSKVDFIINKKLEILVGEKYFKSNIQDIAENYIAISIPINSGEYLPLSKGTLVDVIYYEEDNLYKFKSVVMGRKFENIPILIISYPKEIVRIQRRKYVRVPTISTVKYTNLKNEPKKSPSSIENSEYLKAILLDLSGGGMKIKISEEVKLSQYLLICLTINSEDIHIVGQAMRIIKDDDGRFNCGLSFEFLDTSTREKIIKLIFKLMREQMKKNYGGVVMSIASAASAREQIVKQHIPLVKYIASRVIIGKTKYVEYEDLISYGMLGLMDALGKFDDTKGMKFSSYASIRIKGSMIDELRRNSPISKGAMDKLNKYNRAIEKLQKHLYREPTNCEIATELNITIDAVADIENTINYISIVSLEDLIFSDDDDMPLSGTIKDDKSPSPERTLEEKEQIEYLSLGLDHLKEKDKLVITLYYYEGLTLKEIGNILSVSESRVCQLHSRAIINLRKALSKLKYEI